MYSNDPDSPKLFLTLKGEIVEDLRIEPRSVSFGEVPLGESAVKTATLKLAEPERVKIGKITCEDSRFSPKLTPGEEAGTATLEVTFNGHDKVERIASDIQIELLGEGMKPASVPVRAQVVGDLRFPRQIFLMKRAEKYNTREIVLTSRSDKKFKVLRAEDPDGVVKLEVPKGANSEIRLVASVREAKVGDAKSVRGKILIRTSDAQNPEIEVGYTVSNRDNMRDMREKMRRKKQEQGASKSLKPAQKATPEKFAPVI